LIEHEEKIPLDPPFSKWEDQDQTPPQDPNNTTFIPLFDKEGLGEIPK